MMFFSLMMGMVFFLIGLALTPVISEIVDESTSSAELNCSNESLGQQDRAVCTSIDMNKFLFLGTIFGLAGIIIGGVVGR